MKRWNMKQMKSLIVILLSLFLITGCGGGGSDDEETENEKIGVRVFNLRADATTYDVEILDDETIIESFEDFKFSDNSGYYYFEEDDADITFTPHNGEDPIEKKIECEEGENCSVFFFGDNKDPVIYTNDQKETVAEMPSIRFINGIKGLGGSVTIRYGAEDTLFEKVEYKEFTEYEDLDPGRYTFEIFDSNGGSLFTVDEVNLLKNEIYTIVAMGDAASTVTEYQQKAVIYKDTGDGKSEPYANLMFVNASWDEKTNNLYFSYDENEPDITVLYKLNSQYRTIPEGKFTISVKRGINEDPVKKEIEMSAGEYATIFAIGNLANLKLVKYTDDLTPPKENQTFVRVVHAVDKGSAVDVFDVTDTTPKKLFENITFDPNPIMSTFSPIESNTTGFYNIEVRNHPEGNNIIALKENLPLLDGDIYTFFVAGSIDLPAEITLESIHHKK